MLGFVGEVGATNLRYALNTGHATMYGQTLVEAVESVRAATASLGCVLVNASAADAFGQSYDAHKPVVDSGLDLSPLRGLAEEALVIFDARYTGWDDIYGDVRAVSAALSGE